MSQSILRSAGRELAGTTGLACQVCLMLQMLSQSRWIPSTGGRTTETNAASAAVSTRASAAWVARWPRGAIKEDIDLLGERPVEWQQQILGTPAEPFSSTSTPGKRPWTERMLFPCCNDWLGKWSMRQTSSRGSVADTRCENYTGE